MSHDNVRVGASPGDNSPKENSGRRAGSLFKLKDHVPNPSLLSSHYCYADFVAAPQNTRVEFRWPQSFFEQPGPTPSLTTACVVDRHSTSLEINGAHDTTGLSRLLVRRPGTSTGIRTRIIIVSYPDTRSLDRPLLDFLAMRYAVRPLHLYYHLYHINSEPEPDDPLDLAYNGSELGMGWENHHKAGIFPWENMIQLQTPSFVSHAAIKVDSDFTGLTGERTQSAECNYHAILSFARLAALELDQYMKFLRTYANNANIIDDNGAEMNNEYWVDFRHKFIRLRDSFRISHDNLLRLPPSEVREKSLADYRYIS